MGQLQSDVLLEEVPSQVNESELLYFLQTQEVGWKHVNAIKDLTNFNDDVISDWLNVSVKTLRSYRQPTNSFKDNVKEHVVVLLSLMKHGVRVFGSSRLFDQWLGQSNFFFDNKTPLSFLNTITGIRFVDERLTAMEFGDNV